MATVTLKGTAFKTNAELPEVGAIAPDFSLVDSDLNDRTLNDFQGKKKILSIVPSLDTPVCATSTEKFNEYVQSRDDVVMLVVSADLPFAQKRFCSAANTQNVIPLSMMRSRVFAKNYGVLIENGPLAGITARAVIVLDENNQVIHSQLVTEIGDEPNYDTALSVL